MHECVAGLASKSGIEKQVPCDHTLICEFSCCLTRYEGTFATKSDRSKVCVLAMGRFHGSTIPFANIFNEAAFESERAAWCFSTAI